MAWQISMAGVGVVSWLLWHHRVFLAQECPLGIYAAAAILCFLLWPSSIKQRGPRVGTRTAAVLGMPGLPTCHIQSPDRASHHCGCQYLTYHASIKP